MKKLIIGLAVAIVMVGCAQTQRQESVNADDSRFIKISRDYIECKDYMVVKDKDTGVEYLVVTDNFTSKTGISVTPLYNADGTLKTD